MGPLNSDAFKRIYKKDLPPETPVYEVRGIFDYISLTVNGVENKEFTVGGIRISGASYTRLKNKKVGITLDDYLPNTDEMKKILNDEFNESDTEGMTEEEQEKYSEKLYNRTEELLDEHANHTARFVFLKEANYEKQYAFVVGIDDWDISNS